jgi:hypothetical protein
MAVLGMRPLVMIACLANSLEMDQIAKIALQDTFQYQQVTEPFV